MKHRIRLTCKVCRKVQFTRDYLSRWPSAWYHNSRGCYETTQVCSHKCLDKLEVKPEQPQTLEPAPRYDDVYREGLANMDS